MFLTGVSAIIITAKGAKTAKSFYDLFLCVRVVRVVRGSWNLKGVSLVVKKRVWREGERSWEGKKSLLRGEESL